MRFLYICLALIISATFGLQGADFDIYPSFGSLDDDDSQASKTVDGASMGQILTRLGATVGIGGGAYIGFKLAKSAIKHFRKSSDSSSSSWADDIVHSQVRVPLVSSVNVTMVEEMKKEQEELWRFLHSLFKNQEEMMVKLEKSLNSGVTEKYVKELGDTFDKKIFELSQRLNSLESRLNGVEDDISDKSREQITSENVQKIIQIETKEISESMIVLKKDMKNQMLKYLKEHDDAIVEKIRFFGEDIKKLVKNENPETSTKTPKPKPQVIPSKTTRK